MATRPQTARSDISSAISEDEPTSPLPPPSDRARSTTPAYSSHGYAHFRGVTNPSNTLRNSGASRPQSPESIRSRTHVPSLTASGFMRPMSSSRLQQQRLQNLNIRSARIERERDRERSRPTTGLSSTFGDEANDHDHDHDHDHDNANDNDNDDVHSLRSNRTGPYAPLPPQHRPTASITTGYTESDVYEASSHQANSETGHEYFLKQPAGKRGLASLPSPLDLTGSLGVGSPKEKPLRSPHSFRSGFSIGSKQIIPSSHQHLPSIAPSPRYEMHESEHNMQEKQVVAQQSALGKNYEYFEGNNMFWFGGRLQTARDRPINILTALFILVPSILFFAFSAPWLWHHVSPAIPIVFAYLFFICFSSFIHGSVTDPGIYPRNLHAFPASEDALAVGPPTNDWVMVRLATSETAAMDVPVKYCKTCNIWRPPRCYHCRVCDNCVDTLDHHCVWLNNCVGRRNYRYFFAFVSSGTVLAMLLTFASLGHVLAYSDQEQVSFVSAIKSNRIPFAMFIYGLIAIVYPSSLWVYHLMLTGRGETTREYLAARRFDKSDRHRPFNQGNLFKNWIAALARPRPPTYMHFRQEYESGDQRLGHIRGHQARVAERAKQGDLEMKPVKGQKGFSGPTGRISSPKKDAR